MTHATFCRIPPTDAFVYVEWGSSSKACLALFIVFSIQNNRKVTEDSKWTHTHTHDWIRDLWFQTEGGCASPQWRRSCHNNVQLRENNWQSNYRSTSIIITLNPPVTWHRAPHPQPAPQHPSKRRFHPSCCQVLLPNSDVGFRKKLTLVVYHQQKQQKAQNDTFRTFLSCPSTHEQKHIWVCLVKEQKTTTLVQVWSVVSLEATWEPEGCIGFFGTQNSQLLALSCMPFVWTKGLLTPDTNWQYVKVLSKRISIHLSAFWASTDVIRRKETGTRDSHPR